MSPSRSQKRICVTRLLLQALGVAALSFILGGSLRSEQIVVVVLDDSGSMQDSIATDSGTTSRMAAAKEALAKVVQSLPEDTRLGVRLLNGEMSGVNLIPLDKLQRDEALGKISQVIASGGTPLGESMRSAADELVAYRKQHIYGSYRLLIITDGEAGDPELVSAYLPMILARGISIDVIGVAMKQDHQLASSVHSYRNVNDASSFEQAVSEILAEPTQDQDSVNEFELLAGLPDEFAANAVEALAKVDNTPIAKSTVDTAAASNYSNSGGVNPNSGVNVQVDGGGLGCCAVPCFVVIIIIAVFVNVILQSKKRRR